MHSQVCFHRWHFADHLKPHWYITGPVGPLGCTNQSWCGVKLLVMSVSTHPVGCVHICHILGGQHHTMHPNGSFFTMHPNGRFFLPLACHPPPPPHPTPSHLPIPYTRHPWYYRGCKSYLKSQLWVIHGRDSYCILAIRQLYLYSKSGAAIV